MSWRTPYGLPLLLLLLLLLVSWACSGPRVFTVKVHDEAGLPVENAGVRMTWPSFTADPWNNSGKTHFRYGLTNRQGRYTYIGWSRLEFQLSIFKGGYYEAPEITIQDDLVAKFRIRKQRHPVAMYAKRERVELPLEDGDYAYDLFAGDLIAPHGSGIIADIIFRIHDSIDSGEEELQDEIGGDFLFSSPGDGIQVFFVARPQWPVSNYQAPFVAPETNYRPSLSEAFANTNDPVAGSNPKGFSGPGSTIWYWTDSLRFRHDVESHTRGYFIKVRSASEEGACYGLVRGVQFSHLEKGWVVGFSYYLNPDHTTDIEFCPRLNFFENGRRLTPGYP